MFNDRSSYLGLCSCPQELWPRYQLHYEVSQKLYRDNTAKTLQEVFDPLCNSDWKSFLVSDGSGKVSSCDSDLDKNILFNLMNKLLRTNFFKESGGLSYGSLEDPSTCRMQSMQGSMYTGFSTGSTRYELNFLAYLRIHNPRLPTQYGFFTVTLGDFLEKLKRHCRIDTSIILDNEAYKTPIAQISRVSAAAGHHFCFLVSQQKKTLAILFDNFLSLIENERDPNIKLDAIFALTFLIGSNPPLAGGRGGAFVTDAMLQFLLIKYGFPPIRKNYLNLTEIELFFCYLQNDPSRWTYPRACYQQSCMTSEVNWMFHPQNAPPDALKKFLENVVKPSIEDACSVAICDAILLILK